MKSEKGFTLLELMTTLGIAAILLSVAVPGLQSFVLNSRQSSAVNQMVSAIHLARNTAVTRNSQVTVCASDDGASCSNVAWSSGWITFADEDRDQVLDAGEELLSASDEVARLDIASAQFPAAISYAGNGRVLAPIANGVAGSFSFCDSRGAEKAKVVNIELTGRPTLAANAAANCG